MLYKLQKILDKLPLNYRDNLMEELSIIIYNDIANFMPYFLTLKETVDIAKGNGILKGPVRGSAAASLVCYLFGITDLDPIIYDLPLKRFISRSRLRKSIPDVDIDFPKGKRDIINKIIFERYGARAAFVATFSIMKLKNGLMDSWRINMIQPNEFKIKKLREDNKKEEAIHLKTELDKLTKQFNDVRKSLGNCPVGYSDLEWLEGCERDGAHVPGLLDTNAGFKEWCTKYPEILETAKSLLKIPRSIGQHAAGVVIADVPLHELVPVMKNAEGYNTIVYDKKVCQKLGLVKFDNLGLVTLNFIEDTLSKLKAKGITLDPWDLKSDPDVFNEYIDGHCRTLFQFDTSGGAAFAKKLQPKTKEHLFAGVALNRPGAMDAVITTSDGEEIVAADAYVQRMHGELEVEYLHDDLIPILKDTNAIWCYQEQVSKTIQDLLGYSEEESDTIRAAISDKDPKAFEEVKKRLPMLLARGWTQEQADRLYDTLLAFARYSFNRSHSAGYGILSYTTAYLKHHYPLEWWSSVLTHSTAEKIIEHFWPEISHLIDEPNVNASRQEYAIKGSRIVPPLNLVHGVGDKALEDIASKAPFSSLEDFIERTDSRRTNKKVVINLLKSGAMNVFFENNTSLSEKVQAYLILKALKENKKKLEELPDELKDLNPYKEFLLAKSVLPVSTVKLTDSILNTKEINKPLAFIEGKHYLRGKIPLYNGAELHNLVEKHSSLDSAVECVCYGYVIATRLFNYYSEKHSMSKMALELVIDFDGFQQKTVAWPRQKDVEPVIAKIVKEKTAYLFNLKISSDPNWYFSIIGVDELKKNKTAPAQG